MKIFAFSTYEEAQATIEQTAAKATDDHFTITSNKGVTGKIIITGIGPFSAYTCLEPYMDQASSIINLGIAGALDSTLDTSTIYAIANASKLCWHPQKSALTSPYVVHHCGLRLITLDFPLYESALKDELKDKFDLVDMEGYAIARLAVRHNKPLQLYKAVSDYCDAKSCIAIKNRLPHLSKLLASTALSLLE